MIGRYWPRLVEGTVGVWSIVSAWLLATPDAALAGRVDPFPLAAGITLVALVLTSFRFRRAQLAILAVGVTMVLWNWAAYPRPGPATAQSGILAGLVVCLFGLIPNEPGRPPVAWREYVRERSDERGTG